MGRRSTALMMSVHVAAFVGCLQLVLTYPFVAAAQQTAGTVQQPAEPGVQPSLLRAGHPLWKSRLSVSAYVAADRIVIRRAGRSQEVLERFLERRKIRRKVAMYTSNVLSVPFVVMDTDLVATLPYAVVTRFASITAASIRADLRPEAALAPPLRQRAAQRVAARPAGGRLQRPSMARAAIRPAAVHAAMRTPMHRRTQTTGHEGASGSTDDASNFSCSSGF